MKRGRSNSYQGKRPYKRPRKTPAPEARALIDARRQIALQRKVSGRTELKVSQYSNAAAVDSSGAVWQPIASGLSRGTAFNQFIGNELLPTSFRVQYSIAMGPGVGPTAGDGTNVVRVLVFQWLDSTVPAPAGVLATVSPLSNILWTNRENIHVLADRFHALKQASSATASWDMVVDTIYIKGKKLVPIQYNTITNTPQKGEIMMLIISDSSIATHPYVTFFTQLTFTDS